MTDAPPPSISAARDEAAGQAAAPAARVIARALAVAALSLVAAAFVALVIAGARWGGGGRTLELSGASFSVSGGSGVASSGALIVQATDRSGAFIAVRPDVAINATDYIAIDVEIAGLTEAQPVAVFWRTRLAGGRTFSQPANIVTPGGVRARVDRDPNWNGPIHGLGIVVAGSPPRGAAIIGVRLVGASAGALALDALNSWLRTEHWTNQSINVVFLGGQYQSLPLTLFAGVAMLVALAAWIAWNRRADPRVVALGALVIASVYWLVLDLRWLVNFGIVEARTTAVFAGKSWRDARLAADDGALFAFIEQARVRIAERPGRVFFASDDAWLRVRGGYHLLPFNTLAISYHRHLFAAERYRPGDWMIFYLRAGVAYDPLAQALSWDGLRPVRAERVFADGRGAVYRVLP